MTTLVRAALAALLLASSASAQPFDHLSCAKVKDPAPRASYVATLTPSDGTLAVAPGCIIKVPAKQLCVDVRKHDVSPPPPGAPAGEPAQRYLCYKAKCPRQTATVPAADQFGSRVVEVRKIGLVCAPLAPTTTTTTTTTSTTLPSNFRCCDLGAGCFNADETFVTSLCTELGGTIGTAGQVCDGATTNCGATGAPGQLCCDCPQLPLCSEGAIVPLGDLCSQTPGCTAMVGYVCDGTTRRCRLP